MAPRKNECNDEIGCSTIDFGNTTAVVPDQLARQRVRRAQIWDP